MSLIAKSHSARLLDKYVDQVAVRHLKIPRRLPQGDLLTIEEEADRLHRHALPLAEGVHQ
eukprot:CAMPEP_0180049710 /NCGR_PEP_ID=MMETSP0985-20121206/176_1 /TAXON_ID=483367 /ORGANISM="non described non described, Strain CCMP 2436" /LENGTH=59 /DNA_ID=CAMNT_0021978729 /DNA_START=524 /DNA_END=701 /DNA_ORIENTATION=-